MNPAMLILGVAAGAACALGAIAVCVIIGRRKYVGDVGGADDGVSILPGCQCPCADIAEGVCVDQDEALEAVMSVAAYHPEFAAAWEGAVRAAADEVSGEIAGRQMAGRFSGELAWHATVPMPTGMAPEVGHAAFDVAVRAEVTRRIESMSGPGAFG